ELFFKKDQGYQRKKISRYHTIMCEGGHRSTRPNKENTKTLEKKIFIFQHNLLSALYTFPNDVQ
ncbi:hypothetical protein NL476_27160, partial [Klebsiella pneumoniae]|nr:hypothetical protein [Klebsiella pneumoniae]